jgi:biotin-(acetyl-CoA carboxylase) ligase
MVNFFDEESAKIRAKYPLGGIDDAISSIQKELLFYYMLWSGPRQNGDTRQDTDILNGLTLTAPGFDSVTPYMMGIAVNVHQSLIYDNDHNSRYSIVDEYFRAPLGAKTKIADLIDRVVKMVNPCLVEIKNYNALLKGDIKFADTYKGDRVTLHINVAKLVEQLIISDRESHPIYDEVIKYVNGLPTQGEQPKHKFYMGMSIYPHRHDFFPYIMDDGDMSTCLGFKSLGDMATRAHFPVEIGRLLGGNISAFLKNAANGSSDDVKFFENEDTNLFFQKEPGKFAEIFGSGSTNETTLMWFMCNYAVDRSGVAADKWHETEDAKLELEFDKLIKKEEEYTIEGGGVDVETISAPVDADSDIYRPLVTKAVGEPGAYFWFGPITESPRNVKKIWPYFYGKTTYDTLSTDEKYYADSALPVFKMGEINMPPREGRRGNNPRTMDQISIYDNKVRLSVIGGTKSCEDGGQLWVKPKDSGGSAAAPTPVMYFRYMELLSPERLSRYYNSMEIHKRDTIKLKEYGKKHHLKNSEDHALKLLASNFLEKLRKLDIKHLEDKEGDPLKRAQNEAEHKALVDEATARKKVEADRKAMANDENTAREVATKEAARKRKVEKEAVEAESAREKEISRRKEEEEQKRRTDGSNNETDAPLNVGDKVKLKDGSELTVMGKDADGNIIVKDSEGKGKVVSKNDITKGDITKGDITKGESIGNVNDKVKMKDGSDATIVGKTASGDLIVKKANGSTVTVSPNDVSKKERSLNIGDKVKLKDGSEATIVGKTASGDLIVKKADGSTVTVSPDDVSKKEMSLNIGDKVKLKDGSEATIVGKTASGDLIVKKADGSTVTVSPGDVIKRGSGLSIGSSVQLPDGTTGTVVDIREDGKIVVETDKGQFVYNEHDLVDLGKNQELIDIENEIHGLNEDLKFNERIISELIDNIRRFKTEKHSLDSEARQKHIILHDRKQKELDFIRQSIRIKEQQHEGLKLLIKSELERNRILQENESSRLLIVEQNKVKSMRRKMNYMTQQNLDKNKSLDENDTRSSLDKLRKKNEKNKRRSQKKDGVLRRHRFNAIAVDEIPIFSTTTRKNGRSTKRNNSRKKSSKSPLK